MALSNAERQARYRHRLKNAAANGVTPEMVLQATRLSFEEFAKDDPSAGPNWVAFLARCRMKKNTMWAQFVPDDPEEDYSEYGDDEGLMRSVAAVARMVRRVPDEG